MRPGAGVAARLLLCCLLPLAVLAGGCASVPAPAPDQQVFYPPAPAEPRLQYLTHFSNAGQVIGQPGAVSRFLFGDAAVDDGLAKPYGLALHNGRLYVCDTKLNTLVIFDIAEGRFGYTGVQGAERLRKPLNVCADDAGNKYVADALRGEIVVFDANDAWAGTFGGGKLKRPVDVACDEDRIYVCDAESCTIQIFDAADRQHLGGFGGKGDGPGLFARPTNLALDAEGNVWVSDTINGRIQKLASDGSHLATFGQRGDRPGTFARPKGVAVDPAGRLYAVDAAFENVQVFDGEGRVLMDFGGPGAEAGNLTLPAQVIIDNEHLALFEDRFAPGFKAEYLVLVSSQYGPRMISVYAFGAMGSDR